MVRRSIIAASGSALVLSLLPWVSSPAAAADAVCPSLPAVTAFAQVSGTVTAGGSPLAGAAVYVIDTESGGAVCVLTSASGTFSAALPAVEQGGSPRKPADSWYVIANPDASSGLASAWKAISSSSVTGNVTGQNLALETSNLQARALVDGTSTPIEGPAIMCLIPERQLDPPVTCGITQAFGGSYRAQLAVPATGRYWISGTYLQPSGWFEGWNDTPIITAGSPTMVDVELVPQGSQPCPAGTFPITGVVTKSVSGAAVPVRAAISVLAQWLDSSQGMSGAGLGWADSARDGTYQVCLDPSELPPNKSLQTVNMFLRAEPYAGGVSRIDGLEAGCADGCTWNVSFSESTPFDISGKIRLGGSTPAAGAPWSVAAVMMTAWGPQPGPEVVFGRTDSDGTWGVRGTNLPSGTYLLRAYPPGESQGYALDDSIFTVPGPSFDLSLPLGNLTVQGLLPDNEPAPWTWFQARQCFPRQGCNSQEGEADVNGKATFRLTDGTWTVTAYPPWGSGLVATSAEVVVLEGEVVGWDGGSVPENPTIALRNPNASFKVLQGSGADETTVPQAYVSFAPWSGNQGNEGPWDWESASSGEVNASGLASLWLDGGGSVYQMRVDPPQSVAVPALTGYVQVLGEGADIAITECAAPSDWRVQPCQPGDDSSALNKVGSDWVLKFATPNVTGSVLDPDGDLQPFASIEVARWITDRNGWSYYQQLSGPDGWVQASVSGAYALALTEAGAYRLRVQKPWNSDDTWAPTTYYLDADGNGNVCERTSSGTACTPTGQLTGGSALNLVLSSPNVAGRVKQVNGQALNGGWMGVFRATECPGGGTGCQDYVTGTEIGPTGTFNLSLEASDDTYYLNVYPWQVDDTSVETTFELIVQDGQPYNPDYTLQGSNVAGTVTTSDGLAAPNAWVSAEKRIDMGGWINWTWVRGVNTDDTGAFAMYLPPGQYRFRVEPGPASRAKATSTFVPVGDDTYVTVGASGATTLAIALGTPNVSGNVFLPDGESPAVGSWLEVQEWQANTERYEWSSIVAGTSTGADGGFALDVPNGRWKLVANPPWGNIDASRNELRIVVSESGVCEDNGNGGCQGATFSAGQADITLRSPNVAGSVVRPDGDPAGNTWVDVRGWNAGRQSYEWSPDLQGLNVDNQGLFTAQLADGRYELIANPPWGSSDVSRGIAEIVISGDVVTSVNDSPCPAGGCSEIQIELGSPNLSGQVQWPSPDDTPVAFSHVFVEKWDEDREYWDWADTYTNSTSSGDYALNLTGAGAYRVTARPTSQTSSLAPGRTFVVVEAQPDGGHMCLVADDATARSTSVCAGTDDSLPNTAIHLASPNLPGNVNVSGNGLTDAWIGLLKKSTYGYVWQEGTSTTNDGNFGFDVGLDGGAATEYRIEAHPPWGDAQGLTRKRVDVVAFDESGTIKVCPKAEWSGSACSAGQVLGDDTRLQLAMTGGNVKGFVKTAVSDGQAGVRDTGVSVEKWVVAPWMPGSDYYVWQWTDQYTNTSSGGSFSLNIDDTGAYRITGYPAWNDDSGYSKSSAIVNVNASAKWCAVDDSTGTASNTFDTCTSAYSTDDSRITINLRSSNVTTTVRNTAGSPVRDAWVSIRKKVTFAGGESWLWLGGSSTKANGSFAAFIDDSGTYALEVYPPWEGPDAGLPRFTKEFTVSCPDGGGICIDNLEANISFTAPNMTGKVVSPNDSSAGIANSWVSVEVESSPGNFVWTDLGTSTNRAGEFVMSLPSDDTYRLTANPSWENPVGTRTSVTVVVAADGTAACTSGCLSDNRIQLLAANLTGTLVDGVTPMAYSWVEVRDGDGNWVTGSGTDANGRFSLTVPAGTYKVWGYPNWNVSQKPPKSVDVTVGGSPVTVSIDLGAVTPNVFLYIKDDLGVTGSRLVAVDDSIAGEWVSRPAFTTTSDGASGDLNRAAFALPDGTYRLTVAPAIGKSVVTPESNQVVLTVVGAGPFDDTVTFQETP